MVYSVGEEESLCVDDEVFEIGALAVSGVILKHLLDSLAEFQIVFAVLVPVDVAAPLCGLGEVIDIFLLLQAQLFPSGNVVAHHFQVGEFVDEVFEIAGCLVAAGYKGRCCAGQCKEFHNFLHIFLLVCVSFFPVCDGIVLSAQASKIVKTYAIFAKCLRN